MNERRHKRNHSSNIVKHLLFNMSESMLFLKTTILELCPSQGVIKNSTFDSQEIIKLNNQSRPTSNCHFTLCCKRKYSVVTNCDWPGILWNERIHGIFCHSFIYCSGREMKWVCRQIGVQPNDFHVCPQWWRLKITSNISGITGFSLLGGFTVYGFLI